MTINKKFKRRVRERMQADGVTYSEALRRVEFEAAKPAGVASPLPFPLPVPLPWERSK